MDVEVTPFELYCMSRSHDKSARRLVAVHPLSESTTLSYLAKDEDWVVRFCLPAHSNCTLDILYSLRNDPIAYVRCNVFSSLKASPELLEVGANDLSPEVRLCVIGHPKVKLETLAKLKRDKDARVSLAAKDRLNYFYSRSGK